MCRGLRKARVRTSHGDLHIWVRTPMKIPEDIWIKALAMGLSLAWGFSE